MNRGLYISATSLVANQKKLEVLSNNLANVNATGFKKDMSLTETFPEKLLSIMNGNKPTMNSKGQINVEYEPPEGEIPIHTATIENGYFIVETPNGNSYVKEIRFIIDDEGNWKTYYQDGREDYKTDYENYITDGRGNRMEGAVSLERLESIGYRPAPRVVGTMNAGVKFQKVVIDFTQGNMLETGGTFDFALNGSGFFKIMGDDGNTYYTRDGSFVINEEGYLTTLEGNIVLGINGPINITGPDFTIDINGRITENGVLIDNLDIVDLENREFLRKVGNNLYQIAENVEPQEIPFEGKILQGYLESSNVNAIQEMVEMVTLLREFEAGQKAIRVQDEMLEKASNEIGRV